MTDRTRSILKATPAAACSILCLGGGLAIDRLVTGGSGDYLAFAGSLIGAAVGGLTAIGVVVYQADQQKRERSDLLREAISDTIAALREFERLEEDLVRTGRSGDGAMADAVHLVNVSMEWINAIKNSRIPEDRQVFRASRRLSEASHIWPAGALQQVAVSVDMYGTKGGNFAQYGAPVAELLHKADSLLR